jgi:hypothetical protein
MPALSVESRRKITPVTSKGIGYTALTSCTRILIVSSYVTVPAHDGSYLAAGNRKVAPPPADVGVNSEVGQIDRKIVAKVCNFSAPGSTRMTQVRRVARNDPKASGRPERAVAAK